MEIFHLITAWLDRGENLVVATIVSRTGSAPRGAGSRMVVRRDGAIAGTIGGGVLEARVQRLAAEVFGHGHAVLKNYRLNAADASQMGLVCGGEVQVLVQWLDASRPGNLELYRDIVAALDTSQPAWLITALPLALDTPGAVFQSFRRDGGAMVGDLDHRVVLYLTAQAGPGRAEVLFHQGKPYLLESLCHRGTLYIFGAGHVAQSLAPLATLVGFRTIILDDRREFANRERFPSAAEVIVLDSFQQALEGLPINPDSYLVVVTRGHAYDQTVLGQALSTPAGYIGMIGSRRKRDGIYAALGQVGFSRQDFDRVFSPIGLEIQAETPEEIAVSIVAELIRVRAEKHR
jgi:xanthine dehydrogenase accessory factor